PAHSPPLARANKPSRLTAGAAGLSGGFRWFAGEERPSQTRREGSVRGDERSHGDDRAHQRQEHGCPREPPQPPQLVSVEGSGSHAHRSALPLWSDHDVHEADVQRLRRTTSAEDRAVRYGQELGNGLIKRRTSRAYLCSPAVDSSHAPLSDRLRAPEGRGGHRSLTVRIKSGGSQRRDGSASPCSLSVQSSGRT